MRFFSAFRLFFLIFSLFSSSVFASLGNGVNLYYSSWSQASAACAAARGLPCNGSSATYFYNCVGQCANHRDDYFGSGCSAGTGSDLSQGGLCRPQLNCSDGSTTFNSTCYGTCPSDNVTTLLGTTTVTHYVPPSSNTSTSCVAQSLSCGGSNSVFSVETNTCTTTCKDGSTVSNSLANYPNANTCAAADAVYDAQMTCMAGANNSWDSATKTCSFNPASCIYGANSAGTACLPAPSSSSASSSSSSSSASSSAASSTAASSSGGSGSVTDPSAGSGSSSSGGSGSGSTTDPGTSSGSVSSSSASSSSSSSSSGGSSGGGGSGDLTCGSLACDASIILLMNTVKPILDSILKVSKDTKAGELATIASETATSAAKQGLSLAKLVVISDAVTSILDKVVDIVKRHPADDIFQADVSNKLGDLVGTLSKVKDKFDSLPAKEQFDDLLRKVDLTKDVLDNQFKKLDSIDGSVLDLAKKSGESLDELKGTRLDLRKTKEVIENIVPEIKPELQKIKGSIDDIIPEINPIKPKLDDIVGKLGVLDLIKDLLIKPDDVKSCPDGSNQLEILPCPEPQAKVECVNGQPVVSCSGDPVNCAILKSTSAADCAADIELKEPDKLDFPEFDNSKGHVVIDGSLMAFFFGLLDFGGLPTKEVDVSNQLDKDGLGWSGSCPSPQTYPLGRTGSITIDYSPFCTLAVETSFFVLLLAAAISARILFSI